MIASPEAAGSRLNLIAFGMGVAGIVTLTALALVNRSTWGVDFSQFYAAGSLAGTGHVYDWDVIQVLELQHAGTAVPFLRLPFFAAVLKPLSLLPYSAARTLFLLLELAAAAGSVALWPVARGSWRWTALCWSAPAAICLAFGQDTILFLFVVSLGFWLLFRGHDFWAGVVLSLCASKPHLAVLVPVVLAAQAKWRTLVGGIAGGVVIVALSFAVEGPAWPERWLAQSRLPDFEHTFDRMPNLRGLFTFLGESLALELVVGVGIAGVVYFLSRSISLKCGMILALSVGLLLSHHSYVYDCVVLIPGLLLAFEPGYPKWLRMWAFFLLTPLAYLLLMTDFKLPGHLAITGYTIALLIAIARYRPLVERAATGVPA